MLVSETAVAASAWRRLTTICARYAPDWWLRLHMSPSSSLQGIEGPCGSQTGTFQALSARATSTSQDLDAQAVSPTLPQTPIYACC